MVNRLPRSMNAGDTQGPYAVLAVLAALAARARRTSDGALTAGAAVGVLTVLGLALWRPAWWAAATPLVALGAFGLWGTLERERAARLRETEASAVLRALVVGQWASVVVGTGAVVLAAFRVLGALIGTVIS